MSMGLPEIAGLITGGAGALAVLWQVFNWGRYLVEGQRCLLRSDMTRTYYHHKDEKRIRQYEYENFKSNYHAYRALRGNSFIMKINDEIDTWEVIS